MLFRNTFHPLSYFINFAIAKVGTAKHTTQLQMNVQKKKLKFLGLVNTLQ